MAPARCSKLTWRLLALKGEPPMTRFLAEQLSTPHWYDISAAVRDFGYRPRVSIAEGLALTAEWWRQQGPLRDRFRRSRPWPGRSIVPSR